MTKRTVANNFLYYIFCGFSGAVTSLIVWLFLKLMGLGIGLVWDTIPSNFDFKFYPIIVCTAGGLILGIWQKLTNAVPDELDEVMKKVKKDKFYPYNKVLLLCISALLPLVFGGSLGPEAGLTGVIVGLCYWAGSHMKDAKSKIPELMQIGISATLSAVFYAPLFGLASVNEERLDSEEKPTDIRSTKLISNIIAVLFASGWKGGHFFPVIFCGVSIGYGVAMLGGLDTAFCAAVVTAGLLGVTMKKPLAVTMLLLLCFDARVIPWILLAAFLGSIIPTKIFGNNKKKAK